MKEDFAKHVSALPDADLLNMVQEKEEYRPEAIAAAEAEIERRGGTKKLASDALRKVGSRIMYEFNTRTEGLVSFTDAAVLHSDGSLLVAYGELDAISWKHLTKYVNGVKCEETLTLFLWYLEGGDLSLTQKLPLARARVRFELRDIIAWGRIREKVREEDRKLEVVRRTFYTIISFLGRHFLPSQIEDLRAALSDGHTYRFSDSLLLDGTTFTYKGTFGRKAFSVQDVQNVSVEGGWVQMHTNVGGKVTELLIGSTEDVKRFHLLQHVVMQGSRQRK